MSPAADPDGGRTCAAARLGALFALESPVAVLQQGVTDALLAGVTRDQIGSLLVSVLPAIGMSRAAAVAPALGLALGYDLDDDLEGTRANPPGSAPQAEQTPPVARSG
jgi:hypothetical protein